MRSDISAGAYAANIATYTFITITKLFPQVISYTHTMPSAPAETTTFTGTDWALSEMSELSYKSV